MIINTNINSMLVSERLSEVSKSQDSSLEKLSSGLNISRASDNASGLAIADKLRIQSNSLKQSISNANNGISLIQIADRAMSVQSDIIDTVKQKLLMAATESTSEEGRQILAKDITKLLDQINNISEQTNFNGINPLNRAIDEMQYIVNAPTDAFENAVYDSLTGVTGNTYYYSGRFGYRVDQAADYYDSGSKTLNEDNASSSIVISLMYKPYLGAAWPQSTVVNSDAQSVFSLNLGDGQLFEYDPATLVDTDIILQIGEYDFNDIILTGDINANTAGLGLDELSKSVLSIYEFTSDVASSFLDDVDKAISKLNDWRADFGATQNQLQSSIGNIMTQRTNISIAESEQRDLEYVIEMTNFIK